MEPNGTFFCTTRIAKPAHCFHFEFTHRVPPDLTQQAWPGRISLAPHAPPTLGFARRSIHSRGWVDSTSRFDKTPDFRSKSTSKPFYCVVFLIEVLDRFTQFDSTSTLVDFWLHKVDVAVSRPAARGGGFRHVLWVRGGELRRSTPDTAMVRGARVPLTL